MKYSSTTTWHLFILLFLSLLLSACNETSSSSEIGNTGIKNTSGQISELDLAIAEVVAFKIIPAVNNFNNQAQELNRQVNLSCSLYDSKMTEKSLTRLQNQWVRLNNSWYALMPFLFGPLETPKDELGLIPAYAYIDSFRQDHTNRSSSLRNRINASIKDNNFNENDISTYSYQKTGLLPLELLIFERASNQDTSKIGIINEYLNTNKCSILRGHSKFISALSERISTGWEVNYRFTGVSYAEMFVNNNLDYYFTDKLDGSGMISTTRYITSLKDHFEYLENRNSQLTSAVLANSYWEAITSSYTSANESLSGSDQSSLSIFSFISSTGNNDNVSRLKTNLTAVSDAIENQNINELKTASGLLHDSIEDDLTSALNVSLGLNFSDGD